MGKNGIIHRMKQGARLHTCSNTMTAWLSVDSEYQNNVFISLDTAIKICKDYSIVSVNEGITTYSITPD